MNTLSPSLRKQLERTVGEARDVAEAGARAALEALAVRHCGPYEHMSAEKRTLRRRLRAHARQLGDRLDGGPATQSIDRLVHECAYEHWHGMLFARFLAENHLLIEPELGIAVTLDECEELGKEEGLDRWAMAARFAHRMLPQVFRPAHPAFEIRFAPEHRLELEALLERLPADVFVATDALGWVYQFWQSRKKDEVNRSGVKIGAEELPAVTQLFTEPYMVAFLLDNTLGAWWAARRLSDLDLRCAGDEAELRRKAAIPGVPLDYLRFVRIPLSSPEMGGASETGGSSRNAIDENALEAGGIPGAGGGGGSPRDAERGVEPRDLRKPVGERAGIHLPTSARPPPSPSGRGVGGEGADSSPTLTGREAGAKAARPHRAPNTLPSTSGKTFSPLPPGEGSGVRGEGKRPPIPADILEYARALRSKQTDAEQLLWGLLRDRRFAGRKFRRQHPIGRYILDFYCHEIKLAIELDGGQHNDGETRSYDYRRSRFLREQGIRVLRFWNHDVFLQTDSVLESLWHEVHTGSSSSLLPSPQTPLPEGEGLKPDNFHLPELPDGAIVKDSPEGEGLTSTNLHARVTASRRASESEGEGVRSANLPERMRAMSAEEGFTWTPAAGGFAGWPDDLAELRLLDPCCGSGHFLVAAFSMLVPMRIEVEDVSAREAVDAVLRENLHGLELDPRCVEVAVFALALVAWTYPDAGGYRPLPELNLACSGLAPHATREQWTALSERAAAAGGLAPTRDLFGVEDSLLSAPLRNSMDALHALFEQAPVLGSLIDPHALEANLFQRDFESVRELFAAVLEQERTSDEQTERAVAARGMARAAELLTGQYTLVITNVPYLARGKQGQTLRAFCQRHYPLAKNDLATVFLERCLHLCAEGGTASLVLPQNWLFLTSYRKLREMFLKSENWNLLARLGAGAFETISGEVVKVILLTLSHGRPPGRSVEPVEDDVNPVAMFGLDVSKLQTAREKAARLRETEILAVKQSSQLKNPDTRVTFEETSQQLLRDFANCWQGVVSSDDNKFVFRFWEVHPERPRWEWLQLPPQNTTWFTGRSGAIRWERGVGMLHRSSTAHNFPSSIMLERPGVAFQRMRDLNATLFSGNIFADHVAPLVPDLPENLPAIWCWAISPETKEEIRKIDSTLKAAVGSFVKTPFDVRKWTRIAQEEYPNGLPSPYSDDPTQWIFHGHPCGSVAWDETEKRPIHGPLRTDPTVLQVAVARLLGYRWPAELDSGVELAEEQRDWVRRTEALREWKDEDGIVCIPSVRGEAPAGERLLGLLAAAFGDCWNEGVLTKLLASVASRSLDDWLRDRFFDEHCRLFHHRPFVWHIWDGRRRDGFHALVSYHKLAEGDGKGRRLLESLTYSYLGDWIARQRDGAQRGEEGAEDRLAAACELKKRLEAILGGEPPFDLFVRWKPIHEQPIGWEPDIDDGVRLNIRPLMADDLPGGKKGAGVLRTRPKIAWKKDRGKEVLKPTKRSKPPWLQDEDVAEFEEDQELRPRDDYPWFWTCPGDGPRAGRTDFRGGPDFDGNRWNDLHYTKAAKRFARSERAVEVDS